MNYKANAGSALQMCLCITTFIVMVFTPTQAITQENSCLHRPSHVYTSCCGTKLPNTLRYTNTNLIILHSGFLSVFCGFALGAMGSLKPKVTDNPAFISWQLNFDGNNAETWTLTWCSTSLLRLGTTLRLFSGITTPWVSLRRVK